MKKAGYIAIIVVSMVVTALAVGYGFSRALAQPPTPKRDLPPNYSIYGFGDFQDKSRPGHGENFLHLEKVKTTQWSGFSLPWNAAPFSLKGCNILVVEVTGADTFKAEVLKMMKWYVQYPGQAADVSLICSDPDKRDTTDPSFVTPLNGRFEYPLPQEAVATGTISKLGVTLFESASYGDIKFKVHFEKK